MKKEIKVLVKKVTESLPVKPTTEAVAAVIAIDRPDGTEAKVSPSVVPVEKGANVQAVQLAQAVCPVVQTFRLLLTVVVGLSSWFTATFT